MIRIIYHSADFDGHASGAIARYYFSEFARKEFTMHPYNYGQEFPFDQFKSGDELYFLDVTYQPNDDMMNFEKEYGWSVYICDHHKTVVESDIINHISGGILDQAKSGCELTWEYFFKDKMPEAIHLLDRYDVWDRSNEDRWENVIYPFQMGFKLFDTNPYLERIYNKTWKRMFEFDSVQMENFIDNTIKQGRTIMKYQRSVDKSTVRWLTEELNFDGYRAIVANSPAKNSQFFDSIWDEEKYDIMVMYSRSKYGITTSIYTTKDDIDCSSIAKKYGGGGHRKAAGFGAKNFIIENGVIDFVNT